MPYKPIDTEQREYMIRLEWLEALPVIYKRMAERYGKRSRKVLTLENTISKALLKQWKQQNEIR